MSRWRAPHFCFILTIIIEFLCLADSIFEQPQAAAGLRRSSRIRIRPPRDSYEKVHYGLRVNPATGCRENLPLGYLRYPDESEVRRRRRLLLQRRRSGPAADGGPKSPAGNQQQQKQQRERRLEKLVAKRRRELGKGKGAPLSTGHALGRGDGTLKSIALFPCFVGSSTASGRFFVQENGCTFHAG